MVDAAVQSHSQTSVWRATSEMRHISQIRAPFYRPGNCTHPRRNLHD